MNQRQALSIASRAVGPVTGDWRGGWQYVADGHWHGSPSRPRCIEDRARSVAYRAAVLMGLPADRVGAEVFNYRPAREVGERVTARRLLSIVVKAVRQG